MLALLSFQSTFTPIDEILNRPELKGAMVGVCVSTLEGEVLYSRNADIRLMPASNQKLLSVAYALHKLGPEYVPITKFWKQDGCLIVDSNGDPSMTYDRLLDIRKQLGSKRYKKVSVRQAYRPGYGPGWEWDDLPNRYAPTISAFAYDTASFELWGDANKFWLKNGNLGIRLEWNPDPKSTNQFDLRSKVLLIAAAKPKEPTKIEAFAQPSPDWQAAEVLGGHFSSTTELPDVKPEIESKGSPILEIAKNCLQPSDNYIAESLLMMAASSESPLPIDAFPEAAKRMRAFLTKTVKLDTNDADPYDGSGLSRHNNVTATGIVKLLTWAKRQPWASVWETALAAPGVGTLKNRLKNTSFKGKTGTLNKVSSLSGYVKCKDGRELVVSILMNHYLGSSAVATKAQDDIVEFLASRDANGPKLAITELHVRIVPDKINCLVNGNRVARPHFNSGATSAWARD